MKLKGWDFRPYTSVFCWRSMSVLTKCIGALSRSRETYALFSLLCAPQRAHRWTLSTEALVFVVDMDSRVTVVGIWKPSRYGKLGKRLISVSKTMP